MNVTSGETPQALLARLDQAATRYETPTGAGRMIWRSWGSGPILVLLHGGSGSWRHWVRNIEYFAKDRRVLAPDLPGMRESGFPQIDFPLWGGFVGPAGMPEPVVQRLNAEIGKILATPEIKTKLEDFGYRTAGGTPADFGNRIRDDIAFYGPIIKSVGIQPE